MPIMAQHSVVVNRISIPPQQLKKVPEQMLLSIEAQLCTRKECKTFRPRRPSSVAMHKVRVRHCPT